MEEKEISLRDILMALKKRWYLILLITVFTTAISAVASMYLIKPTYEASTKIFVGKPAKQETVETANDIATYHKMMKTYAELIQTNDLIKHAMSKASIDTPVSDIAANLSVTPIVDTQILEITYKGEDPQIVADTLTVIVTDFEVEAKKLMGIAEPSVLEQVAVPEKPISPNKKMNVAIAFVLGIMVSIGLIMLIEATQDTFREKYDLEGEFHLQVLGVIPDINEK